MSNKRNISRRSFLGEASCAALGSTAFLSSVLNLGVINTLSARPHILSNNEDYKAMVCILLAGGADSFNMLVPTDASEFTAYQNIRADLALSQDNLTTITPSNTGGKVFGIHNGFTNADPNATSVKTLFDNNRLAFLSNVGTLIEPLANKTEVYSGNKRLPLGLYSHADQIMQWQTSVPQSRSAVGVGGRIADILNDMQTLSGVSMNISLDGKNRFQAGNQVIEFSIPNNATPDNLGVESVVPWWGNSGFVSQLRDQTVNNLIEDVYSNIFQDTYGSLTRQTIESIDLFKASLAKKPNVNTNFSESRLSQDMRMMAEVISVRNELGNNRQIFFTTFGGWDHHDEVLNNQDRMIPILGNALAEFQDALEELGLADKVVTFTISDFGRTLTSNGNGSDHAWGGNQIIMGGMVDGGKIFGTYPNFDLDDPLNLDERGRFIPTTSVDEFYAELALWFGVSPNDLDYILPNLCNFYSSPASCPQPVPTNYAPIGMFV